jgi:hypothetical protein
MMPNQSCHPTPVKRFWCLPGRPSRLAHGPIPVATTFCFQSLATACLRPSNANRWNSRPSGPLTSPNQTLQPTRPSLDVTYDP